MYRQCVDRYTEDALQPTIAVARTRSLSLLHNCPTDSEHCPSNRAVWDNDAKPPWLGGVGAGGRLDLASSLKARQTRANLIYSDRKSSIAKAFLPRYESGAS